MLGVLVFYENQVSSQCASRYREQLCGLLAEAWTLQQTKVTLDHVSSSDDSESDSESVSVRLFGWAELSVTQRRRVRLVSERCETLLLVKDNGM